MLCIESRTGKRWHGSQSLIDRHNSSQHDVKLQTHLLQTDSMAPKLSRLGISERSCRYWLRMHEGEAAAIRKRCEGTGGTDSPKRYSRSHEQSYCLTNEDWDSLFCSHELSADGLDCFEVSKQVSIFQEGGAASQTARRISSQVCTHPGW